MGPVLVSISFFPPKGPGYCDLHCSGPDWFKFGGPSQEIGAHLVISDSSSCSAEARAGFTCFGQTQDIFYICMALFVARGRNGGSRISRAPWPPNTFPSSAARPGVTSLGGQGGPSTSTCVTWLHCVRGCDVMLPFRRFIGRCRISTCRYALLAAQGACGRKVPLKAAAWCFSSAQAGGHSSHRLASHAVFHFLVFPLLFVRQWPVHAAGAGRSCRRNGPAEGGEGVIFFHLAKLRRPCHFSRTGRRGASTCTSSTWSPSRMHGAQNCPSL